MAEIFLQARASDALSEPADARIARLHRYYLARQFAAGAEVIDLRGGDGSGPALLAQVARRVVAGMADAAAVAAARTDFPCATLEFVEHEAVGDAERHGADLVVAFGLLARAPDPAAFIARLRRLVRQGGTLLLDVPPRDRLERDARHLFRAADVHDLLAAQFAHVRLLAQRGMIGSALVARAGTPPPTVFAHRDRLHVETTRGIEVPESLVCIAADHARDAGADSLFIDADLSALAAAQARAVQAGFELDHLRTDHAHLSAQTAADRQSDAQWRHQLAVLRVNEAAARTEAADARAERDGVMRASITTIARVQELERAASDRAAAREAECAELRARLAQPVPRREFALRSRLRGLRPGMRARLDAVRASPYFDAAWYAAHNADVRSAGLDPARHYLRHGAAEGRDPGPEFSARYYAAQHADLAASGLSALEHYERHGRAAGWPTQAPLPAEPPPVRASNPKVLFIAGESETPGAQYRCVRMAEAATAAGWSAGWSALEHTGALELIGVEIAVLWRVQYSDHVAGIMREVHASGGTVVFDVDDLMIRPELATTRVIDGIRTTNAGIGSTRETFAQVQKAMIHADLCTTTTLELAEHMRAWQKATYILPNGFDEATLARSRRAVRARIAPAERVVRIGYAAGTMTHQRDFAVALPGLLRVFASRPEARLVLFRAKGGPELVVTEEFDALTPYADRIEWRDKVDLADLPDELARFDINIVPLECGNPFCEAKSELKYFEAALVNVPTIASSTGPFARTIVDGQTGLLAADDDAWEQALLRLIDDAERRVAIGRAAYHDCLWRFGPQRRAELVDGFLRQVQGTTAGARAFALDVLQQRDQIHRPSRRIALPRAERVHHSDRGADAAVTVVVPCYNYADFVIDALETVRLQTLTPLDLVVVDDGSPDPLVGDLVLHWARTHEQRFNRLLVIRHIDNAGLSAARNTGIDAAETPFVLPLDADNRLRPQCCATLLARLAGTDAAYAYGSLQMFGAANSVFCNERYQPIRFVGGNYIDAMALIGKWAWAAAGGYDMPRGMGWEDFDFWCRLAELAQRGVHVNEVLAEYRVHGGSMVTNLVEIEQNKQCMVALIEQRHDWLRLSSRTPHARV